MTELELTDIEQRVAQAAIDYDHRLRRSPIWLYVDNPEVALPDHGWKLHISARTSEFDRIIDIVVPVLLAAGCPFKMARSRRVLQSLNDGRRGAATVGKAWTIYPDPAHIQQLGIRLAELLHGEKAPRVLSDRKVSDDAPVYYRYGPFRRQLVADVDGQLTTTMTGPNGESFDGHAKPTYRQPPWVVDPFTGLVADGTADLVDILGDHYRPLAGLLQAGHGNVYRAEDIRTGESVVVKQARAYVAESASGDDARLRLRNERYVLERLAGLTGVPRYFDHFRHGDDEYLVTSFCGEFNLAEDVPRNGRYRPSSPAVTGRTLDRLAIRLAQILTDVHDNGFIVADLSPKNIVISQSTGEPTLIDFGLCNHGTVRIPGGTPGYASPAQLNGEPATFAGDLRALGMTLLFAATGANPVTTAADPHLSALQTIGRIYGGTPPPTVRCVIGLLRADVEALQALKAGHPEHFSDTTALPPVNRIGRTDVPELIDHLLDDLLVRVDKLLDHSGEWPEVNAYRGAAGVGLELLHHAHRPDASEMAQRLTRFAAAGAQRTRLQPGLFVGSTGIAILLQRLHEANLDIPRLPTDLARPATDWQPHGVDLVVGAAGVGLGHLLQAESASTAPHDRQHHLAVARRCANILSDHPHAESRYTAADLPLAAGLDAAAGLSHGQAGIITFLLHLTRTGTIGHDYPALQTGIDTLYQQTRSLIERSEHSTAVPLCVSWCRGLAGIGTTLLRIAETRDDAQAMDLAIAAGNTCAAWIPYLAYPGACCGIAGVGDFLVSLAAATHDDRFTEAAWSAATQLIIRGIAADNESSYTAEQSNIVCWATGHAGTLAFLRRLHTGDPPSVIGPF
ncbi:lanthionine synthetase LanC family protein [Nocardia sp. NPDC050175]|uniref:class III lanthionine synthetase LanKC N-terminal domain-containing protein n=1 Tax=Nocardia sp. NPDC050175 TaxID=3364317 RepID=UPI00379DDF78